MFDWFKRPDYSNVVKHPAVWVSPPLPEVTTPPEDTFDNSNAYYYLGKNKSGNVSIVMGNSTLTLSPAAVVEMIERLASMIDDQYEISVDYINNKNDQA